MEIIIVEVIILYGYGYSFIVYNSMHPLQEVESYPPLMKNPRLTPFTKKAAFMLFLLQQHLHICHNTSH